MRLASGIAACTSPVGRVMRSTEHEIKRHVKGSRGRYMHPLMTLSLIWGDPYWEGFPEIRELVFPLLVQDIEEMML